MPTTNLDIIKGAMKKLHVLPAGTEPREGQAFDGMAILKSLYVELIGSGSLGRLYDVLATSNYTAYEFDRVIASAGITVTLPITITQERPCCYDGYWGGYSDYGWGCGISTYPRPPRDRALIVVKDDSGQHEWVWSTYRNEWVDLLAATQQSNFPLSVHLEDGFKAILAERWADDWAQVLGDATKRAAGICRDMLAAKRDSGRSRAVAEFF
jgi:hypothetical protein